MTHQLYKASAEADETTAGIMACYEALSPEGKAEVDRLAWKLVDACRPSRPGLQGLSKTGAIEVIGKLLMWLDGGR